MHFDKQGRLYYKQKYEVIKPRQFGESLTEEEKQKLAVMRCQKCGGVYEYGKTICRKCSKEKEPTENRRRKTTICEGRLFRIAGRSPTWKRGCGAKFEDGRCQHLSTCEVHAFLLGQAKRP